jgi:hypothetical protein
MQSLPPTTTTTKEATAAHTIQRFWQGRFKHNTLWHLVFNIDKLKLTIKATKRMG